MLGPRSAAARPQLAIALPCEPNSFVVIHERASVQILLDDPCARTENGVNYNGYVLRSSPSHSHSHLH